MFRIFVIASSVSANTCSLRPSAGRAHRKPADAGRSALQGEQTRPVRQEAVVTAGTRTTSLVEQLQVARVHCHRLIGVAADQVAVADVVGPGGAAVRLAGEGVALGGGLRRPRTPEAGCGERAEVSPVGTDRLDDHEVLVL